MRSCSRRPRELLASNRLYRTTATNAGDPALAGALDRLEGVLAEVANDPNLTAWICSGCATR